MLSAIVLLGLSACGGSQPTGESGTAGSNRSGLEVNVLVGSALGKFCEQTAEKFNAQAPKLASGEDFYVTCRALGTGDVVSEVLNTAKQVQSGSLAADAPGLPSLISLDGEIYHSQLLYQLEQIVPGQTYVPPITDAPLLASSPMVFMVREDLASSVQGKADLFVALTQAETHRDLDPASPPQKIFYVHTAPTRSNSGLQTLVAQFASVSGKRPEALTVEDVAKHQAAVQAIQKKITRYGVSTDSLAKAMAQNGPFWASIGSVYESSVIAVNQNLPPGQPKFVAVYPKATFTSNMRGILLSAPWVNESEKEGAKAFLDYLQQPEAQTIASELGLRPGTPGIPLSSQFSPQFGVDPNARYDSYRPPAPAVVDAMVKSWLDFAKKPSLVVLVVDSSGSMRGDKMPAVQSTLQTYLNSLSPNDQVALIDFDDEIRPPVFADGTPDGKQRGLDFVYGLQVNGGTRLYDASLAARDWLKQNLRPDAINAVLVLTDGEDSGSTTGLDALLTTLKESDFSSDERISFFTIGYGKEGDFNAEVLQQIAGSTGGYYRRGDPESIARVMQDIQLEF